MFVRRESHRDGDSLKHGEVIPASGRDESPQSHDLTTTATTAASPTGKIEHNSDNIGLETIKNVCNSGSSETDIGHLDLSLNNEPLTHMESGTDQVLDPDDSAKNKLNGLAVDSSVEYTGSCKLEDDRVDGSSSAETQNFGNGDECVRQHGFARAPCHRPARSALASARNALRAFSRGCMYAVEETPTMVAGLVLTILFCVILIIIFAATHRDVRAHVGALSALCVVLCLSTALLVALPWFRVMRRCGGALALFVWALLYIIAIVFAFTGGPVSAWEQVAFFLFLSFSVYSVLPLSLLWALVFGIGTSASHIIIFSVYTSVTAPGTTDLAVQLVANAVLFLCVNCVGAFHRGLTERANRKSMREQQNFNQVRMQMNLQKRQQEHLLLSVLPRYIVLELKMEEIKRLSKKPSNEEIRQNFHSLYIRQHKHVRVSAQNRMSPCIFQAFVQWCLEVCEPHGDGHHFCIKS